MKNKKLSGLQNSFPEVFGVKIELHSNREAIIDGAINVTDYFENRIKFNTHKNSVTFNGNGLEIVSFLDSGAIIKGEITSVEFGG